MFRVWQPLLASVNPPRRCVFTTSTIKSYEACEGKCCSIPTPAPARPAWRSAAAPQCGLCQSCPPTGRWRATPLLQISRRRVGVIAVCNGDSHRRHASTSDSADGRCLAHQLCSRQLRQLRRRLVLQRRRQHLHRYRRLPPYQPRPYTAPQKALPGGLQLSRWCAWLPLG